VIILTVEIITTLTFASIAGIYQHGIRLAVRADRPHMAAAYRIERNGWLTLTAIALIVVILTAIALTLDTIDGAP